MTIRRQDELEALQAAGRIVARTLAAMRAAVRPGMTAGELDSVAGADAYLARDGWTVRTADRALAAHYEQTLVVTRCGPRVLTA